ncbi:MAG: pyridoxamine 5'-phosphate oxidase family protein [Syntrophales bacterium]|nr:pyridoxamine 5'-phosphate oxidase family protein [Syntrophales bacterium]
MSNQIDIKEFVEDALQVSRFAVLSTEGDGQPHASLIAITPAGDYRQMIFATYRGTRKYRNLVENSKVAVFIDGRDMVTSGPRESFVLTALGNAEEIENAEHNEALRAHLERHPDLESFLRSADCALFHVTVGAYQVVRGIDDVRWWSIDDPAAT